ncbi:hypothetical protein LTS10_011870 [Elasticomyces elasticus]|nr:hypothetical protein LTS10_011870 [Elasticomyces elasticus]
MHFHIATIVALTTILIAVNATAAEEREGRNSLLNMTGNKTSCYEACKPALDVLLFGEQNTDEQESHQHATTSCVTACEDEKWTLWYNNQVAEQRKRTAEAEEVLRLADEVLHLMAGDTWTEDGWMISDQRDETGTKSLAYY